MLISPPTSGLINPDRGAAATFPPPLRATIPTRRRLMMIRSGAAHRPGRTSRLALTSAVTVAEIQRRLRRETALAARPPRVITVVARPTASA